MNNRIIGHSVFLRWKLTNENRPIRNTSDVKKETPEEGRNNLRAKFPDRYIPKGFQRMAAFDRKTEGKETLLLLALKTQAKH